MIEVEITIKALVVADRPQDAIQHAVQNFIYTDVEHGVPDGSILDAQHKIKVDGKDYEYGKISEPDKKQSPE